MSDVQKITSSHLDRVSIVYLRQSSAAQVEHNRESTERRYALTAKAHENPFNDFRTAMLFAAAVIR
jgi:hypothetical protein